MFGNVSRLVALATVVLVGACGGGDLSVFHPGGSSSSSDAGTDLDAGTTSGPPDMASDASAPMVDGGNNATADAGGMDAAMPADMGNTDPTTNVPQQGPTVGHQVNSQCSTSAVKGLSLQLIDQMNCEQPGIMKSFAGAPSISYGSSVFPFQQGPATDTLTKLAKSYSGSIQINSALRTLPGQYLLYQWYLKGLCNANLAAPPGRSNHNGGLALDIQNNNTWRTRLRNVSYIDNVSGEPWHFYYSGPGGKDVRSLSVLAFQKLYNRNFPENKIAEDGLYGPQTEAALKKSPANGFTVPPNCPAVQSLVAFPNRVPLDLRFEHLGRRFVGVHVVAPTGVVLVEYVVDGEVVGYSDQGGSEQFESVLDLSAADGDVGKIEAIAYDSRGVERGHVHGLVTLEGDYDVFVRPLGGPNYEVGLEDVPNNVRSIEYWVNGMPVEPDPNLAVSSPEKDRIALQLDHPADIDVVLLDKRGRVIKVVTRSL